MITIKDIAKRAGVSVSTASRALNHNSRISQKTIDRVEKIANELGYQPNQSAKTLSSGESTAVGVIFPVTEKDAPANPFHLDLIRGMNTELQTMGRVLSVAICQTSEALLTNVKQMVEQAKIHHFLVLYSYQDDPVTQYLRESGQNFVVVGTPDNPKDRFVDNNNLLAGKKATIFLLEQYQVHHPLFIRSTGHWNYEKNREEGYRSTLPEADQLVLQISEQTTNQQLRQFVEDHPEIDGIVAVDDIELLIFYHNLGFLSEIYQVPTVCFNSSRLIDMAGLKVDKVDMQPKLIGQQAVKLLFKPQQHQKLIGFDIQ